MELTQRHLSRSSSRSTRSLPNGGVFSVESVESTPGFRAFLVHGGNARAVFADEAGGHRWQRVPPNEKHGRVHTSTVTVAVLQERSAAEIDVRERDLEWQMCRGSGPGGQHRNKTESAVQLTHRPSGLRVRVESERSQHRNRELALTVLRARLSEHVSRLVEGAEAAARRAQVGTGMRGDKRRTIRTQDGVVVDHPTGRRWRFRDYERGDW